MSDQLTAAGPRHSGPKSPANAEGPDVGTGVPAWFDLLIVIVLAAVLSFGSIGVLLAFFADYRPALIYPLGSLSTLAIVVLGRGRIRGAGRSPLRVTVPAVAMLLVAVASIVGNSALDGHYVQVDRDPGVYEVAAKWLSEHGSLEVQGGVAWYTKNADVDWSSSGLYPEGNGRLEFQFAHFMPALMAEGQDLGGDRAMFAVPAVVGGLSLLVMFAVGCRLLKRPWLALVAVTAVGIGLPQLVVSRDSYSETATQLLLWGSIWAMLRAWERGRIRHAMFAGVVVGATMTTRIDALLYLIAVPLALALAWLAVRGTQLRGRVAGGTAAFVLSVVPGTLLGFFDTRDRGGGYYAALKSQVHGLQLAVIASAIVSIALALSWPTMSRARLWPTLQRRLAVALPALFVVGMFGLWFVRPQVYHPKTSASANIGVLQQAAGLAVDPTRSYAEQTMYWMSSYLGPPALVLAIVGAAVLLSTTIRRGDPTAMLVLMVAGIGTLLYLWSPSITPDQIWASRRFVPAGFPLLTLCAAVGVEAVADFLAARRVAAGKVRRSPGAGLLSGFKQPGSGRPGSGLATPVGIVGAVLLLVFPLVGTARVWNFRTQANLIGLIRQTCTDLGPDAAVLFTYPDLSGRVLVQTMRSYCGVPAAGATTTTSPANVTSVAAQWKAAGKTMWVMSYTEQGVLSLAPNAASVTRIGSASSPKELAQTLNKAPSTFTTRTLTLYGAPVPVPV